jgi:hypothetical protein
MEISEIVGLTPLCFASPHNQEKIRLVLRFFIVVSRLVLKHHTRAGVEARRLQLADNSRQDINDGLANSHQCTFAWIFQKNIRTSRFFKPFAFKINILNEKFNDIRVGRLQHSRKVNGECLVIGV